MLERVRQTFLHDPVGREVDRPRAAGTARRRRGARREARRGRPRRASESRPSRPGCGARSASSPSRRMAPRRRRISASAVRPACSTRPERVAVLVQRVRQLVPDRADLEHHDADGVRDDVVELARDARALLGDGDARGRPRARARPASRAPPPLPPAPPAHAEQSRRASATTNRRVMKTSWLAVGCAGML